MLPGLSETHVLIASGIGIGTLFALKRLKRKKAKLKLLVIDDTEGVVKELPANEIAGLIVGQDEDKLVIVPKSPDVRAYKKKTKEGLGETVYVAVGVGEVGFVGDAKDFIAPSVLSLADNTESVEEFIENVTEIVSREAKVRVLGVDVALPFNLSKSMKQYNALVAKNLVAMLQALKSLFGNAQALKELSEMFERVGSTRARVLQSLALVILMAGFAAMLVLSILAGK